MIDLSQSTVLLLILSSALIGIAHGLIYDGIRLFKMMLGVDYGKAAVEPTSVGKRIFLYAVTFLCDAVFCISFAISSILLTYNVSGGVFRGIVYVGMLGGGALYYLTLGRLVLKINVKLAKHIKKIIRWLVGKLIMPFKAIISLIIKLYHLTIGKVIGKIISVICARREQRKNVANKAMPRLPEYSEEEACKDVKKYRYKEQGRISFAGRRR
ncbi:MAG: hypothetical protein E7649_00295 [Ruminococcaceae bacterium]|nr:hypothetical protein [Oscillospiraceae bacterium]